LAAGSRQAANGKIESRKLILWEHQKERFQKNISFSEAGIEIKLALLQEFPKP